MATIEEILRETSTMAQQRDAAAAAATAQAAGGVKALLMALPIGARVIDLVSGEEGVVVDGHRENVVIPIASQPGS